MPYILYPNQFMRREGIWDPSFYHVPRLYSPNGRYSFHVWYDSNLIVILHLPNGTQYAVYRLGTTIGDKLIMQSDGNLVLYETRRWPGQMVAVAHTATYGNPGAYLYMQNDGNLVIYRNGQALWSTWYNSFHILRYF